MYKKDEKSAVVSLLAILVIFAVVLFVQIITPALLSAFTIIQAIFR